MTVCFGSKAASTVSKPVFSEQTFFMLFHFINISYIQKRKLVRKIEVFYKDFILGSFRAFDFGLILGSFSYNGNSEDEIGTSMTVIEEFIGHNPIPVYLGQKYGDKLRLQITLVKNPNLRDMYFHERDSRWILRLLTGIKGYQWMKVVPYELDDDIWYRAKVNNVSYKRVGGHIVGIILNMECDSCFAYSKEFNITVKAKSNQKFNIFNNTDDLNNYVYPTISILSSSAGTLSINNLSDHNWITEIKNVKANEKITIDSKHQIISSNTTHNLILNDFNLGWFRMIPGKNEYISNFNITITLKYREPRKVGVVE